MNTLASKSSVPFEFAREHLLLPLDQAVHGKSSTSICCLSVGTHPGAALDNLSLFLDAPIKLIPTPESEVRDAITRTYQEQMTHSNALLQASSPTDNSATAAPNIEQALQNLSDRDLLASGDKAPVAKLVDAFLFDSLTKHARTTESRGGGKQLLGL